VQTDIAQPGRTQQRVTNCMYQDVRIRVPQQSLFMGNFGTAQHQFPPCHQPVDIIPDSGSHEFSLVQDSLLIITESQRASI
jgi:hypothetical protein